MFNSTQLLKEYNLKVTPQRIAIVEELHKGGHMNIDELYKVLLNNFPTISLATIYKNINAMLEKVFVKEVKIPNEKSVYELVKESHSHLVCSECGKVEDIVIDVNDLVSKVSNTSNYRVEEASLIFTGTCKDCQ